MMEEKKDEKKEKPDKLGVLNKTCYKHKLAKMKEEGRIRPDFTLRACSSAVDRLRRRPLKPSDSPLAREVHAKLYAFDGRATSKRAKPIPKPTRKSTKLGRKRT